MIYKIKSEHLNSKVTIKIKSTSITYNLNAISQSTAKMLFWNGYKHLFEDFDSQMEQEISNEKIVAQNEQEPSIAPSESPLKPDDSNEELFSIVKEKGKKKCIACKPTTPRKKKPKS